MVVELAVWVGELQQDMAGKAPSEVSGVPVGRIGERREGAGRWYGVARHALARGASF